MCWKILSLILIAIGNSSCYTQEPALVDNQGSKYFGYSEGLSKEYRAPNVYPSSIIARPGISLRSIASENRVDIQDIMAINSIYDGNFIFNEETRVYLPNYVIHKIKVGETLNKLSRFYRIPVQTIIQANQLNNPNSLEVNQDLKIYISRKSHVNTENKKEAFTFNGVPNEVRVTTYKKPEIGTKVLPNVHHPIKQPTLEKPIERSKPINIKPDDKLPMKHGDDKIVTQIKSPEKLTKVESIKIIKPNKIDPNMLINKELKKTYPKGFIWPVRGRIVHPFGESEKGIKNEGINIATKMHAPIIATEDGEIVFSGSEVPGFGKLIIIKHKNDWYSSYGHQHDNAVSVGEKIKKGDVIAYAGKSGNVGDIQLFFSLQKNKKPVNPVKYLK